MPKTGFTRKMNDYDTFTKIDLEWGRLGQIHCRQRLKKVVQSPKYRPIWSHCRHCSVNSSVTSILPPWVRVQAHHQCFKQLIFQMCHVEKTKIKRGRDWPAFKKATSYHLFLNQRFYKELRQAKNKLLSLNVGLRSYNKTSTITNWV